MWMGRVFWHLDWFFVFCIISSYYSFYNKKIQRSTYYSLFLSILYMTWSNATATAERGRGWTKWTKCNCSWRSGDPDCSSSTPKANVHEFVSEKSEWPRPSDQFKDDHEFQRRVSVFIIFATVEEQFKANASIQFKIFIYKSERTATLLISGDLACSSSTLLRPTRLITFRSQEKWSAESQRGDKPLCESKQCLLAWKLKQISAFSGGKVLSVTINHFRAEFFFESKQRLLAWKLKKIAYVSFSGEMKAIYGVNWYIKL